MVVVAFGGALDLGLKAKMSELGLRRLCRADINMLDKTLMRYVGLKLILMVPTAWGSTSSTCSLAFSLLMSTRRSTTFPTPKVEQELDFTVVWCKNLDSAKTATLLRFSIWRWSEKVLHVHSSPSLEIISATNLEDGSEESDSGSASLHSKL